MKPPTLVVRGLRATHAMLCLVAALAAMPCGAGVASPVHAYYYFVHWMSMGRTDLALEQFTDDAVVVAGPTCVQASPCIGKAAIQAGYLAALGREVALPLQDQQFDGRQLRTRGETILQRVPGEVDVRLRGGHVFEFRDGLIASVHTELDLADPSTAVIAEHRRLRNSRVSASEAVQRNGETRMRREDLVGTWSLESLVAKGSNGIEAFPLGESPRGFLTYTPNGHMSAVLMSTGRPKFASADVRAGTPEEVRQAFDGFDAYAGTYEFDEQEGRVTHFAEVARLPNWEGTAQIRYARMIGEHLHLVTPPVLARGQEWVLDVSWRRATGGQK